MWYKNSGKENDVALSSRIRLARNLSEYPFSEKLNEKQAEEIINKIKAVFNDKEGWNADDMSSFSETERGALVEKHIISREFAAKKDKACLISNDEKSVYIMVLEEDHLRIQSVVAGLDLDSALSAVFEAENMIDEAVDIAYSEKLGYITHCPTNLGTGMRASVMLHLPAYTAAGYMRNLSYELTKMGFTIRGMGGEGSKAVAYLYQISNEVTLGMSEEETVSKLEGIVKQIIAKERELRNSISSDRREELIEKARRDIGIIMYAGRLSSSEIMSMYSELRLSAALGYITMPVNMVDELFVESMPNMIRVGNDKIKTPLDRDRARASRAREIIGQAKLA